jgi:hyperosmotically inducible protein
MKAFGSVVVAAALVAAVPVAARAAAPQTQPAATTTTADSSLESKIDKKIKDSDLKKYNVKVAVHDGVATLTGTVATEADRRKAAQMATMSGIARVDNQIVVDLDASRAKGTTGKIDKGAEKTKEGVDKAIDKSAAGISKATDKSKEAGATAADKSAQGVSKAGEAITDVWIKARVKSKFVDEDVLKGSDISVDVNDHVVTLSGPVPSEAARLRAIEETKKVDGVRQVIDKMTIGPKR